MLTYESANRGDKSLRAERVPWEYVPRHQRKGYLDRDFFVSDRWYRPIWSGGDEVGLIRYGVLMGTITDWQKENG